ncbi:pyruvate formate lyase activating enzyme [Tirmania nivea]|nr:pyruvate formate lyase activating enzyme [Tirmania nivea]
MNPYISTIFTLLLIHRAYTRSSLTPPAIFSATFTALIHASHPTALPFTLLITFYLLGTTATKVKKAEKEKLTVSSGGGHGEHEGRGVIQVLANSGAASTLCLVDFAVRKGWLELGELEEVIGRWSTAGKGWFGGETGWVGDLLVVGVVANYAATTADTLSSELGILSKSKPRLILNPWKICPPGTNGAVSGVGLGAAMLGAAIIGGVSSYWFNPTTTSPAVSTMGFILFTTVIGLSGSFLDSILGAIFQHSVIDIRTNRIVENPYGGKVLVTPGETRIQPPIKKEAVEVEKYEVGGSRKVVQGSLGWLDNNGVNVSMAVGMSLMGMVAWWVLVGDIRG